MESYIAFLALHLEAAEERHHLVTRRHLVLAATGAGRLARQIQRASALVPEGLEALQFRHLAWLLLPATTSPVALPR